MKLGTRGRYAVMAMTDLAAFGAGEPVSLSAIAERQDISRTYLEQLFGALRKAGLVASARGAAGGYVLARPAAAIRVADIVMAVDESLLAVRCADLEAGRGCTGRSERCLTHDLWDELGRQLFVFLAGVTLEDVASGRVLGRARGPAPVTMPEAAPAAMLEAAS